MIYGIGTDIVEIERIKKLYEKQGEVFANKILAKKEVKQLESKNTESHKICFLAKRFAAKEAFVKALGTGFRDLNFSDIVIVNDVLGKPEIECSEHLKKILTVRFDKFHNIKIDISLSDERSYAQAFVVISLKAI